MNLLAVDIGNTTIAFGVFRNNKLALSFKLPTHHKSKIFYRNSILNKIKEKDYDKIIICSVVPKKTIILKEALSEIFQSKILVVGKDIIVPIKNKYKFTQQAGQDRLVNAFAGLKIFGPGLIIIDFGTAITFDLVSKKGEFLGGLIFPGLDLSLDALHKKTALLPKIKLNRPKDLIGNDTISCINNGIIFGMAGVCDNIIERLEKRYKNYKIIATGGNAGFIKQFTKKIKIMRSNLTFQGLSLLTSL